MSNGKEFNRGLVQGFFCQCLRNFEDRAILLKEKRVKKSRQRIGELIRKEQNVRKLYRLPLQCP